MPTRPRQRSNELWRFCCDDVAGTKISVGISREGFPVRGPRLFGFVFVPVTPVCLRPRSVLAGRARRHGRTDVLGIVMPAGTDRARGGGATKGVAPTMPVLHTPTRTTQRAYLIAHTHGPYRAGSARSRAQEDRAGRPTGSGQDGVALVAREVGQGVPDVDLALAGPDLCPSGLHGRPPKRPPGRLDRGCPEVKGWGCRARTTDRGGRR